MHERLNGSNTHLPKIFHKGYELCFFAHDVATQLLKSGHEHGIFSAQLDEILDDADSTELPDLVEIIKNKNLTSKLPEILVSRIFPAVLGDSLHYIFEALEAARKGKTSVAYTLLRKPLQDNLMVLESIIENENQFADRLSCTPPKFNRGDDLASHTARISATLKKIGYSSAFDAEYIAQLRYDKSCEDSFDGFCNKATHLITSKSIVKTTAYSLNFIFPTSQSLNMQWAFLFSRLPYILTYTTALCEYISKRFALTFPEYTDDMERRTAALYIMNTLELEAFISPPLAHLTIYFHEWLASHCKKEGYKEPDADDLLRMSTSGAFPGEPEELVQARFATFEALAKLY